MRKDLLLIGLLVTTLALMAVPISQALVDVFLAVNISLAVVMLIVAVYLKSPSDFSTFPSVILIATAFRLALSIGTTRLILSDADAGQIIETFGDFVVSGSIAIGLVIFLIITVVQFLVITKGAERVAEVAARFALDSLPGKQMSIDSEVRAGNLTADEGKEKREQLDKNSQFFGAMDGAMKFVKGDAIAGLIIICINLIGGIIVGISLHGYSVPEAIGVFSLLTIGDGLVAQFPALLISLCSGIMVTRTSNEKSVDLGTDISAELISDIRVPSIAATIILLVGLIPGFPTFVFASIAVLLFVAGFGLRRQIAVQDAERDIDVEEEIQPLAVEDPQSLAISDRLVLGLTPTTIASVNVTALEDGLLDRFWSLYVQRGVRFPRPNIVEIDEIESSIGFQLILDEVPLIEVALEPEHVLLSDADFKVASKAIDLSDSPEFETRVLNGYWVPERRLSELEELGLESYSWVDIISQITFNIFEKNVATLFSTAILDELTESLRSVDPKTMELIEEEISRPALLKMFKILVEDGVPLRPASYLISSLYYWVHNQEDLTSATLAESLRSSMKRQLCYSIAHKSGVLGMVLLDPDVEAMIRRNLNSTFPNTPEPANYGIAVDAETSEMLLAQFATLDQSHKNGAYQLVLIVSADLRRRLRNFLAANDIQFPVLAPHEISSDLPSIPIDVVSLAKRSRKPAAMASI